MIYNPQLEGSDYKYGHASYHLRCQAGDQTRAGGSGRQQHPKAHSFPALYVIHPFAQEACVAA